MKNSLPNLQEILEKYYNILFICIYYNLQKMLMKDNIRLFP